MSEEVLRQLAAWWRTCKGDESFRTAMQFCANQLEMVLDGELPPFTAQVYQGGKTPHWLPAALKEKHP